MYMLSKSSLKNCNWSVLFDQMIEITIRRHYLNLNLTPKAVESSMPAPTVLNLETFLVHAHSKRELLVPSLDQQ